MTDSTSPTSRERNAPSPSFAGDRRHAAGTRALWAMLVLASAPVVLDLVRHMTTSSWTWYTLAFPPLALRAVSQARRGRARGIAAIVLLSLGLGLQGWAIASGELRHGRPGVVLAVIGLLLLEGRTALRPLLLVVLCMPIPRVLLTLLDGPAPELLARAGTALARALGSSALAVQRTIELPQGVLHVGETDVGWQTAVLAFGLTWYGFIRERRSLAISIAASIAAGLGGLGVHAALTTLVLAVASPEWAGLADMARDVLAIGGGAAMAWLTVRWTLERTGGSARARPAAA